MACTSSKMPQLPQAKSVEQPGSLSTSRMTLTLGRGQGELCVDYSFPHFHLAPGCFHKAACAQTVALHLLDCTDDI